MRDYYRYSNCLLATLNARVVIHPETGDTQHPLWIDLDQHRTFFGSISSSLPPQVHVDRSVHRDHDIELQIVLSPVSTTKILIQYLILLKM